MYVAFIRLLVVCFYAVIYNNVALYVYNIYNVTLMFVCHLFACLAKAALSALVVDDGLA